MEIIDLFPQTIAHTELTSLTPDIITRAKEIIDSEPAQGIQGDGTYTSEQQILNKPVFKEVQQEIIEICLEYTRAIFHEVKRIGICNSWGNVVGFNENIRYHSHDNSYISGVLYLTDGSQLNILNPTGSEIYGCFAPNKNKGGNTEENFRSWDSFNVPPKPGRIVIFPSGLKHSVLPSGSQEKRYSIAFNAIPLGNFGIPTGMIHIEMPE
jgi:uncharacterized protein (TIGR02466 family)